MLTYYLLKSPAQQGITVVTSLLQEEYIMECQFFQIISLPRADIFLIRTFQSHAKCSISVSVIFSEYTIFCNDLYLGFALLHFFQKPVLRSASLEYDI